MRRFHYFVSLQLFWLGLAHAGTPSATQIKEVFGSPENFQAIMGEEKVTVCRLGTPPKEAGSGPYHKLADYVPGPEKELPMDLVIQFREALRDAAADYDEEDEPAGGPIPFRYRVHFPNQKIYLYFIDNMGFMVTAVNGKANGRLWVSEHALLLRLAVAKSLFPKEP